MILPSDLTVIVAHEFVRSNILATMDLYDLLSLALQIIEIYRSVIRESDLPIVDEYVGTMTQVDQLPRADE